MTDDARPDEVATYESVRAVKSEIGRELMLRHGAHAIGIARRDGKGEAGTPVLTFYVEPGITPSVAIPPVIEHTLEGHTTPTRISTQVVERPRALRD